MAKKKIYEVPEHLERTILRPIVEIFCDEYICKHEFVNYIVKLVEFNDKQGAGKANIYFCKKDGTYVHIVLVIPLTRKIVDGRIQYKTDDPIIEKRMVTKTIKKIS